MREELAPIIDLVQPLRWFVGTICGQADNREMATAIVAIGFVAAAILLAGVKKMAPRFVDLVSSVPSHKILLVTLALSVYSAMLFRLAWSIGLWSSTLLLDSILEIAFVGLPTILIACRATSMKSVFGELVLPELEDCLSKDEENEMKVRDRQAASATDQCWNSLNTARRATSRLYSIGADRALEDYRVIDGLINGYFVDAYHTAMEKDGLFVAKRHREALAKLDGCIDDLISHARTDLKMIG